MLRAGSIGLLGLGLQQAGLLRALGEANGTRPKAKSVIFIFLSGGLSQIDTFDMKPDASEEVRGEFKPIATRTPGLHICEHLPMLAQRSHLWGLCRSISHDSNDHSQGHHMMLTGRSDIPVGFSPNKPTPSDWPSIAALANKTLVPRTNLPASMVLPEKIVHNTGRTIPGQFSGMLGDHHEPFFVESSRYNPASYGAYPDYLFHHAQGKVDGTRMRFRAPDLSLPQSVSLDRLRDRLALSRHISAQQDHLEEAAASRDMDRYEKMAVSLLADPKTRKAFDVHGADPKLQDKYGRNAFGWSLLMARQLVEAGVNLVQVNLGNNEAWDTHEAAFPNLKNFLLPPTDRAVSALLDDLQNRGMLDDTLVVMASEFGRTPKISKLPNVSLPGRDHWGAAQTAFFAGGGVTGGAVVGSTDPFGAYPASDPQRPEDFAATIYHALGIPAHTTWNDSSGRPYHVYNGQPIAGLFG
ncbi:MAG: DUF1501 domain-containing protein [Verrucomicrobia bacterium]|nr:DUF1501 domain-containing protein [Verrucomicrobiota bacterium]